MSRALLTLALVAIAASPALAQDHVQRHLVYRFTLGVQNDAHETAPAVQYELPEGPAGPLSANPDSSSGTANSTSRTVIGTGDTHYAGVASDVGTIAVDVSGIQPDGGLLVSVSEAGQNYRKAAPMTCAVYPTAKIACSGQIFPEEAAVLTTLSPAFFDPSRLDGKNHWHEDGGVPGLSLDFTASAPRGNFVTIAEDRNQKFSEGLGGTLHGSATFTYDTAKRVATALKAYDTERPAQGQPGQYTNIVYDITATLVTDNATTAKN
jgi:hypothetical protein